MYGRCTRTPGRRCRDVLADPARGELAAWMPRLDTPAFSWPQLATPAELAGVNNFHGLKLQTFLIAGFDRKSIFSEVTNRAALSDRRAVYAVAHARVASRRSPTPFAPF